ncbi:MAG: hypothetical protein KTR25_09260 [Myxococcales bacterium]|nr:hypothetical protein [Myxococcales bacterium]
MGAPQRYQTVALVWIYVAAIAIACWVGNHTKPDPWTVQVLDPCPALLLFTLLHRPLKQWFITLVIASAVEFSLRHLLGSNMSTAVALTTQTSVLALVAGLLLQQAGQISLQRLNLNSLIRFSYALLIGVLLSTSISHGIGWVLGIPFDIFNWQLQGLNSTLSVFATLPFLLAWRKLPRFEWRLSRCLEAGTLTLLWIGFGYLAAHEASRSHAEILFLLVPVSVWTASRFGLRWGTFGNLVLVLLVPRSKLLNPDSVTWAISQEALLLLLVLSSLWLAMLVYERDQILRTSKSSEARLWAIMASIPDLILQVDSNGNCMEYMGITNLRRPVDNPTPLDAFLPLSAAHKLRDAVQEVLRDQTPRECRIRHLVQDLEKWFEARIAPIQATGSRSERSYAMVSIRDITDDHLSQRRAATTEKARALQDLTGGVAHDFNNLLTTIIGNLDLIRLEVDGPEHRASLDDAVRAANRGRELTHSLLAYSESQQLQPKTLNLARFLPTLLPQLQLSPRSQLTLQSDLKQMGPWTVCVDPDRLESALRSLIDNAHDASGNQGLVTIRADRRKMSEEPNEPSRSFVRLLIEDNGEGMSVQTLNRACDPFFTTRGVGRTGLGLSVVRGFARQSGGHLQLRSQTGFGTRASLFLPLVGISQNNVDPTGLPNGDCIVIAADRNPDVRRLVGRHAARLGYVPLEASSIGETETLLHRLGVVALLVAEDYLPGGKGGQALLNATPDQPAILLAELSTLAGVSHVLRKPFKPGELGAMMSELLPERATIAIPDMDESWPDQSIIDLCI